MSGTNEGTTTPAAGIPAPHGPSGEGPLHLDVRYFAGAAAAAGMDGETITLPHGSRLADLVTALHHGHAGRMDRVLAASSFLVDGLHAGPELRLHDGASVDVLPPFAGG